MSSRHESIINRILSKIIGVKIAVRENLYYETLKGNLDFADDDLPNWRAVKALLNGSNAVTLKISAATSIPYNIVMTTTYSIFGVKPTLITEIPTPGDGTGTKLTEFKDIVINKNYTDNTFTTLASIDVYGHADGSGNFAEDTYLTIKI